MTNNFHTPIPVAPVKPPADSETFNAPLGELDAAITDHENRINTLEDEFAPKSNNPTEYLDGEGNWTVPAGTGASIDGHVIQDEGVDLPQRAKINFVGVGVTVTNEAGGTQVSIDGGVQSVVGGNNVTIDNTDPNNPIVNASAVQSVVAGNNVSVDNTDPENPVVSASFDLENHMINSAFSRWERATSAPMTDDAYNAPDRWYSLVQGAGATIEQGGNIGASKNSCKITAGGVTNRYGIAQIEESQKSIGKRGKTVVAQIKIKPVNNAGSGFRSYRIAVLEWTGTSDAVTSEIVNNWTSSDYILGNFFASTSLVLVATTSKSIAHNTEDILSVSGSISSSCNNLIVFIWVENAPTHASDYALFGEPGLYISSFVQSWLPPDPVKDLQNCLKFFFSLGGGAVYEAIGTGFCYSTTQGMIPVMFPVEMSAAPTLAYSNVGHWALRRPAAFIAATAITLNYATKKGGEIYVTVASGLTATDATVLLAYNTLSARLTFDAEL